MYQELPKSKACIISQAKLSSAPLVTSACLHPQVSSYNSLKIKVLT